MNRLREEMKVIPRLAWVIAICLVPGCIVVLLAIRASTGRDDIGASPSGIGTAGLLLPFAFAIIMAAVFFVFILLVGYVNGDARRRGMRPVLWTLLAIFVPNAIGIILYFILREPLLRPCFKCGASVQTSFPFCPVCGVALAQTCPACKATVQPGWSHCARCGIALRTP